jgi:hypothetical protein
VSRAAVYALLSGDTQLSALGITPATIYSANAIDDAERKPFVMLRWEETQSRWGLRNSPGKQVLTVWAHDQSGSYARINLILERVREILSESFHIVGADGRILTQADWRGDSADLWDDGFRTITRNSAYDIVSREAA